MTRLIPATLALKVAVGLITLAAIGEGAMAATPTAVFGAATGKPQAPGAAVYGVTVGGTPAAPTLAAAVLNQSPESPPSAPSQDVPQQAVSSLAFVANRVSGSMDLLASNILYGDAYTLPGPSYSAPVDLYNSYSNPCAVFPAGLGADASGNFLGAGSYPNYQANCDGQVLGLFIYLSTEVGFQPALMDNVNSDLGLIPANGVAISTIADAVVAPASYPNGVQAGDLLVLVGDPYPAPGEVIPPPVVFRYPHSAVVQGLNSGFPVAGATALVTESLLPIAATYDHPVAMAMSPLDGRLLIATTDGTIWQLAPTANGYGPATAYAVPNGCFEDCGFTWGKIGAGTLGGSLYVLATIADNYGSTVNESGLIEMFSGPLPAGQNYYSAPSTVLTLQAVQPTSVAVLPYRSGSTLASNCFVTPCDILGDGTITTLIRGNTAGIPAGATITEQECVVPADPRGLHCGAGSPGGAQTLPLKQVCPTFSDSLVIPSYLCGSPGFIVIASSADLVDNTTGIEVITAAKTTPELGYDTGCPADRVAFQSNDHSATETQPFPEWPYLFEVENSCSPDPANKTGPHASINAVGFELDLGQFAVAGKHGKPGTVGFVDFKFNNLQQTIQDSNIKYPWERAVLVLGVAIAKQLVDIGHYDCAAEITYLLDKFVRRHVGDFLHSVPGAGVREPNPAFDIIMRLSNAFFSIETGIELKAPYSSWPLAADPHLCRTHECDVPGADK